MRKYQRLYDYITYFDTVKVEEACRWTGGENKDGYITLPFPEYDEKLLDFIREVSQTNLMDKEYFDTLEKYDFLNEADHRLNAIDTANIELTKAILTFYTRGERFSDGLWARALKDKVFYRLLSRLRQLEEKNEI